MCASRFYGWNIEMLKFKKIDEENNTPFDTSILDGISDPVLIVDEQELVIDYEELGFNDLSEYMPEIMKIV